LFGFLALLQYFPFAKCLVSCIRHKPRETTQV